MIVDAQLKVPEVTAQRPLLDLSVKPLPEGVAVKEAQVPEVYHVPPLMIQPPLSTLRVPLPLNGVPGGLVPVGAVVVVVGDPVGAAPLLGMYLKLAGHVDLEPSGSAATNWPVCTEPRTL